MQLRDFWSACLFLINTKVCTPPVVRGYTKLSQLSCWSKLSILSAMESHAIWTCDLIVHGGDVPVCEAKCVQMLKRGEASAGLKKTKMQVSCRLRQALSFGSSGKIGR